MPLLTRLLLMGMEAARCYSIQSPLRRVHPVSLLRNHLPCSPSSQSISTDGTFAEVASAKDVYANCVKALQGEVAARRRALAELRALITRQVSAGDRRVWTGGRTGGRWIAAYVCGRPTCFKM